MLKGIDQLLTGAMLLALDRMGHGDAIAIVDSNFPAWKISNGEFIGLPGAGGGRTLRAVLSVFPLDAVEPITLMQAPDELLAAQLELVADLPSTAERSIEYVDRWKFYELAGAHALIVQTGDSRPFGNIILRKGGINL